ncbi:MAG TPA: hypothetical protein PKE49_11580, partial [Leptospiraceae bacterium]|nr:hypothetical protein [Leptospiraceae bacterium]
RVLAQSHTAIDSLSRSGKPAPAIFPAGPAPRVSAKARPFFYTKLIFTKRTGLRLHAPSISDLQINLHRGVV